MSFAVLHVENAEEHIRGYVRRFLVEVATNLYVGTASTKVIDRIWERLESLSTCRAILVTPGGDEKGYDVRLHRTEAVTVVDYDGVKLVARSR